MSRARSSIRAALSLRAALPAIAAAAALGVLQPVAATAADLYPNGGSPHSGSPHAGSPYDDPRYADLYGPERRDVPPGTYGAVPGYGGKPQYDPKYDDDRYADRGDKYAPRPPYDKRYDDYRDHRPYADKYLGPPGPAYGRYRRGFRRNWRHRRYARPGDCVPRRVVIRRLRRAGWYGFRGLVFRGRKVAVTAANADGGRYRLLIARCSGEIIKARPLDYRRDYGPRAYGPRVYGMYRAPAPAAPYPYK